MNRIEEILVCRDFVHDYLNGRWQKFTNNNNNFKDSCIGAGSSFLSDFHQILSSIAPVELLKDEWKPPRNCLRISIDEIRLRYCISYLLSAFNDLACGYDFHFSCKVELFCLSFNDLLNGDPDLSSIVDLFLLPESFLRLGQSLRIFYMAHSRRLNNSFPRKMTIVLGMHRSGTSALTGLLGNAGLAGPSDALGATKNNLKGYWESESLVTSADLFLSSQSSHWSQLFSWTSCWWQSSEAFTWIESYWNDLQKVYNIEDHIILKDPRLCILVEGMIPSLVESLLSISFLLILRSPVEVVISLCKAEKISPQTALNLWIGSVLRSENATRNYSRKIFTFSQLVNDPQAVLGVCSELWGASHMPYNIINAQSFVTSSLYRNKSEMIRETFLEANPELSDLLCLADQIYDLFGQLDQDSNFCGRLEVFRREWIVLIAQQ